MSIEQPGTVAAAFIEAVGRFAPREAIVAPDGRRFTYGELRDETARRVKALRGLGVGAGDRVAIWLPNHPEWVFNQYACALLGATVIPVNARYRAPEAEYVLATGRAKVLLTRAAFLSNDYLARLGEIAGGPLGEGAGARIAALPALERIVMVDDAEVPGTVTLSAALAAGDEPDLEALAAARSPRDILWIFWTSGSTGKPKGALLDQDAVGNVWYWSTHVACYRGDDRVLTSFPVYYIAGNYWCMLASLLHGAALVMADELTVEDIVERCRSERVTVLSGIPFMLKDIVHDPAFDASAFETVRMGFHGGASLPVPDLQTIVDRVGYDYLVQVYGMTELQGFCMSTAHDDPPEVAFTTCGRPFPGFDIRLIDPQTGAAVVEGEPGELIVRGRRLVDYEGITEDDRARFFDAEGFYHTGDVLRQRPEDGRYEFVTRVKDLIKVGGENATAAEIESVLKQHPKIFTPQVIGVPDARRGEVPAALVELHPGETLTLDELRAWCRDRMAPYKVPRRLHVVAPGGWPRAASGKIARFALAAMLDGAGEVPASNPSAAG